MIFGHVRDTIFLRGIVKPNHVDKARGKVYDAHSDNQMLNIIKK